MIFLKIKKQLYLTTTNEFTNYDYTNDIEYRASNMRMANC
jgi:hypothetical protein